MQDAEVTKSLVAFEQGLKFAFALFVLVFFLKSVANQVINLTSFQAKVASITLYNNYRPFLMKKQCYQQVYLSQTKVHYEACVAELFHT